MDTLTVSVPEAAKLVPSMRVVKAANGIALALAATWFLTTVPLTVANIANLLFCAGPAMAVIFGIAGIMLRGVVQAVQQLLPPIRLDVKLTPTQLEIVRSWGPIRLGTVQRDVFDLDVPRQPPGKVLLLDDSDLDESERTVLTAGRVLPSSANWLRNRLREVSESSRERADGDVPAELVHLAGQRGSTGRSDLAAVVHGSPNTAPLTGLIIVGLFVLLGVLALQNPHLSVGSMLSVVLVTAPATAWLASCWGELIKLLSATRTDVWVRGTTLRARTRWLGRLVRDDEMDVETVHLPDGLLFLDGSRNLVLDGRDSPEEIQWLRKQLERATQTDAVSRYLLRGDRAEG